MRYCEPQARLPKDWRPIPESALLNIIMPALAQAEHA
jgi:hypothetical protein